MLLVSGLWLLTAASSTAVSRSISACSRWTRAPERRKEASERSRRPLVREIASRVRLDRPWARCSMDAACCCRCLPRSSRADSRYLMSRSRASARLSPVGELFSRVSLIVPLVREPVAISGVLLALLRLAFALTAQAAARSCPSLPPWLLPGTSWYWSSSTVARMPTGTWGRRKSASAPRFLVMDGSRRVILDDADPRFRNAAREAGERAASAAGNRAVA